MQLFHVIPFFFFFYSRSDIGIDIFRDSPLRSRLILIRSYSTEIPIRIFFYLLSPFLRRSIYEPQRMTNFRFFKKYPEYQRYFTAFMDTPLNELPANKRFQAHCASVITALNNVIDFLHDPGLMEASLIGLVERHKKRGQTKEEFQVRKLENRVLYIYIYTKRERLRLLSNTNILSLSFLFFSFLYYLEIIRLKEQARYNKYIYIYNNNREERGSLF